MASGEMTTAEFERFLRLQYQDFVERRCGKPKPEIIIEHQPGIAARPDGNAK